MFRWQRVLVLVVFAVASPSWAAPPRQFTYPPAGYGDGWPTFSPTGDRVAFGRYPLGQALLTDIYVAEVATGAEQILVSGLPAGWNPNGGLEWSPDGAHLMFYNQCCGQPSTLWVADVPEPVLPKILATTETTNQGQSDAIASDGSIYRFDLNGNGQITSQRIGNLFGGPAPSPILSAAHGDAGGIMVTLQNGDVWQWFSATSQGLMVGNLFLAAGVTAVNSLATAPAVSSAGASRPNPFNPVTTIPYTLASSGRVSIRVYDVSGRLIRTLEDGVRPAGSNTVRWDGKDNAGGRVASGAYIARITFSDGTTEEKKMSVLK